MIQLIHIPLICILSFAIPSDSTHYCKEAIIVDGYAFNQVDIELVTSDIYYNKKSCSYNFYETCSVRIEDDNNVEKLLIHLNNNKIDNLLSDKK